MANPTPKVNDRNLVHIHPWVTPEVKQRLEAERARRAYGSPSKITIGTILCELVSEHVPPVTPEVPSPAQKRKPARNNNDRARRVPAA